MRATPQGSNPAERWRGEARRRRRRVRGPLERAGLRAGPRRVVPLGGPAETGPESPAARLRGALEELGPVFAAFGRYLATRADLLPPLARQELATIDDRARALDGAEAAGHVARALGCETVYDLFVEFSLEAVRGGPLTQTHRARLATGQPVLVTLVRPDAEAACRRDLELLPELEGALAHVTWDGADVRPAVETFQKALPEQLDLGRTAAALELLTGDGPQVGAFTVPAVHGRLSTARVLTVGEVIGSDVATATHDRRELARRLLQAWLRQALQGSVFPAAPSAETVRVAPDGELVVDGGSFASLGREARFHLHEYLVAAAAEDGDLACSFLLKEMTRGTPRQEAALRQRVRQAVPFRDVGWGSRDDLAEVVLLHWQIARDTGHHPDGPVLEFLRALAGLTAVVRSLAPGSDGLRDALEVVRTEMGFTELQSMLGAEAWTRNMAEAAAMLVTLPERLNEALTLTADGGAVLKLRVVEPAGERRRKGRSAAVLAAGLGLTALLLVGYRVVPAGVLDVWGDRLAAIAFLGLGALLLRVLDRQGS